MRNVISAIALLALLPPTSASSADRVDSQALPKAQSLNLGEILTIRSDVLNENRKVLIRLPDDYDASEPRKYPFQKDLQAHLVASGMVSGVDMYRIFCRYRLPHRCQNRGW